MQVFVLIYTVGYDSGHKKLIGLYSTEEKAKSAKMADMHKNPINMECGYSITKIEVDKTINEVFVEW